jgi:hypothetical protein
MDDDWFNSLLAEHAAERRREHVLLWARLEREAAEHAARYTRPAHYVHPSAERNRDIWVARHRDGLKLREIGAKFGLTGARVRMIVLAEDRRREKAANKPPATPKSRPIDMGGIRDQWQHWTPETNAIELGLVK